MAGVGHSFTVCKCSIRSLKIFIAASVHLQHLKFSQSKRTGVPRTALTTSLSPPEYTLPETYWPCYASLQTPNSCQLSRAQSNYFSNQGLGSFTSISCTFTQTQPNPYNLSLIGPTTPRVCQLKILYDYLLNNININRI